MVFTKGEVDRLGEKIRDQGFELSEDTLDNLQKFRISHKDSLAQIFQVLCQLSRQINLSSIVTYRIKRFESIISKLHRHPDMRFSRMWDIGGCRCILKDDTEIYKLRDLISSQLVIRKQTDYIERPQADGYQSLHLFVSLKNDDKVIEVQLRNVDDHNWATLVEISDLLFDAKLKEFGDNKELLRLHYLLSKKDILTLNESLEIARIIKDYDYVRSLSAVFSRNYIEVRRQWLKIENRSNFKFFLIEANKAEVPKITAFSRFNEAEENYFNIYRSRQHANIVLMHLPKPKYSQISLAYSNYILTYHSFIDDWFNILEHIIVDCLEKQRIWKAIRYYNLYTETSYNHMKNVVSEVIETKRFGKKRSYLRRRQLSKKEHEWIRDISEGLEKRRSQQIEFLRALGASFPKTWFRKFILNQGFNSVNNKYRRRFKKLFDSI